MARGLGTALLTMMRWRALLLAICAWALPCLAAPPGAAADEAEIKAAVIFNLLPFVQWPAGSQAPNQPLVLCAAEDSRLAPALARFGGMRVRDASFSFQPIGRHMDRLAGCQAVFVDAGDPYTLLRVAAASRSQALLVIAEGDHALQQGANIGLVLADNRVAFDIGLAALRAQGFYVSAKLLRLARHVVE